MVERREGTSTGADIVFSYGSDNIDRGMEGVDFLKRRPTFPLGDDPRGREMFIQIADSASENFYDGRPVFRGYHGKAPLAGQKLGQPQRVGKLETLKVLRPQPFNRSVDFNALEAAKAVEISDQLATDFAILFPSVVITSPAPGSSFSPGSTIEIRATVSAQRSITAATLVVDGHPRDRRSLKRADQGATTSHEFIFLYTIPITRASGPMDITIHGFNLTVAAQGQIADDARNFPPQGDPVDYGLGSLDGRLGEGQGAQKPPLTPMLEQTFFLRTPDGVSSIVVQVV